jgi:hypothetical protein
LDGIHDILLLVEKSLTHIGSPRQIFVQPGENGGIMNQRLDAGIPRLRGGGIHIPALGDVTIGQDDLRGQGGGSENLRQQRIRIEGDGLENLVQSLRRRQRSGGRWLGRERRSLGSRRNAGAEENNQSGLEAEFHCSILFGLGDKRRQFSDTAPNTP